MSSTSLNKKPNADERTAKVVAAQVSGEVAELIREDAKSEERTDSFVIKRILEKHYAKRLKALAQTQQRRAA